MIRSAYHRARVAIGAARASRRMASEWFHLGMAVATVEAILTTARLRHGGEPVLHLRWQGGTWDLRAFAHDHQAVVTHHVEGGSLLEALANLLASLDEAS